MPVSQSLLKIITDFFLIIGALHIVASLVVMNRGWRARKYVWFSTGAWIMAGTIIACYAAYKFQSPKPWYLPLEMIGLIYWYSQDISLQKKPKPSR